MLQMIDELNKSGPFEDATLVTLDVVGLYTNIPHNDMEEALRYFLLQHDGEGLPPLEDVIKVVNFVLSNNFFSFEGQLYKQIHGTAMGTPMAPAIANLFMGLLEKRLLDNSPVPISYEEWKRFIDDVFLLWLHPADKLDEFVEFVNSLHPTIKFTVTSSQTEIPYLDILIKLQDGYLVTDLHTKSTDAHAYLHYTSCHPRHCRDNVPYSQFLRLRRLCSSEDSFRQ